LLSVLENHLHQNGVFYIEVASYDSVNSETILGSLQYSMNTRYEYYFNLHKSLDDLLHTMTSSKRKQIRKAERLGVETKEENTVQAMEYVQTFHTLSMQRRNIPVRPWNDHDRTIAAELLASGRIKILVSYHDGEPVNAEMLGTFNHHAYGLVSGSSDQGNEVCGPTHLTWSAIKIFKDEGYSVLSLGGAKEEETGLACYKRELGAISVPMPSGRKIISKLGANLNRLRLLLQR
jgi:lipid II:glycine glycyltransferase (peptidoglycan interpeptide bridge formation enzyme)